MIVHVLSSMISARLLILFKLGAVLYFFKLFNLGTRFSAFNEHGGRRGR